MRALHPILSRNIPGNGNGSLKLLGVWHSSSIKFQGSWKVLMIP